MTCGAGATANTAMYTSGASALQPHFLQVVVDVLGPEPVLGIPSQTDIQEHRPNDATRTHVRFSKEVMGP